MSDLTKYLDEVKARCEKATKGPWKDTGLVIGGDEEEPAIKGLYEDFVLGYNGCGSHEISINKFDADFILQARTDIPKLIEIVESYRTEIKTLREALEFYADNDNWENDENGNEWDFMENSIIWGVAHIKAMKALTASKERLGE